MMSVVYLNTFAEGAEVGRPEEISAQLLPGVARTWKRSGAVVHYELYLMDTVRFKGVSKDFLIGDIGCAKIMLPMETEFTALQSGQRPEQLLRHRIAAVVEDYDLEDEGNPVLVLNRKRALDRLQQINEKRVVPGGQAYGVIQGMSHGGYYMNVGGYPARMPKFWYDWDTSRTGSVGEGFEVTVRDVRDGWLIVSRRNLLPNPLEQIQIQEGAKVRAKITHIYNGSFKAEIRPGVRIRISTPTMFHLLHVGDTVMAEVRGQDREGFIGVVR